MSKMTIYIIAITVFVGLVACFLVKPKSRMNPQNLVFGFSIPRSADPKNVFEIMSSTAIYCQKRLGGRILDQNMQPFNLEESRKEIKELLNNMKSKGIEAGSDKALRMF